MRRRPVLLALAALAAVAAVRGGPADDAPDSPYERALRKSVRRAQLELQRELDLWEDHSSWDDPWIARSEHYEVRTTHSRGLARDLARGLDQMLGFFQSVLRRRYTPDAPFQVHVFPGLAEYNEFGTQHGAEHSSFYGSFFASAAPGQPVATYFVENRVLLRMWVTHGATHQFVAAAFGSEGPPWISEGLAAYFALYWDNAYGPAELERISAQGGDIPLGELLAAPEARYTDRPHERLVQLGMLFTYLLSFRDDTRLVYDGEELVSAPFADYVVAVLRSQNVEANPVHELFTVDLEALELDFRGFEFPR